MTDEELIKRMRSQIGDDVQCIYDHEALFRIASDRIELLATTCEQLVATNEALVKERDQWVEHTKNAVWADSEELKLANARAEQLAATCERLEALLREARTDLEDYVTQEYPKHAHPYYERQWNRDMEFCRRIDAALEELKGN